MVGTIYYDILKFQIHLFNLVAQFKQPVAEEEKGDEPAPGEPSEPRRSARALRGSAAQRSFKHCTCEKVYDYDDEESNGVMGACCASGLCHGNPDKYYHLSCIGKTKDQFDKGDW